MLSNQVLHKTVQDIRRITELEGSVWDLRGTCLVMTNEKQTALYKKATLDVVVHVHQVADGAYFVGDVGPLNLSPSQIRTCGFPAYGSS